MPILKDADHMMLRENLEETRARRLKAHEKALLSRKPWLLSARFNRGEVEYTPNRTIGRIPLT